MQARPEQGQEEPILRKKNSCEKRPMIMKKGSMVENKNNKKDKMRDNQENFSDNLN